MTLQCKCSYGGPMRMERNERGCPIHDTKAYEVMSSAWHSYGWRLGDPIRDAIESGGDVFAAIASARQQLDKLEVVAKGVLRG